MSPDSVISVGILTYLRKKSIDGGYLKRLDFKKA